ncbi:MAG: hypothetical protein ACM3JB_18035 [Acidobacteriaceae bacterium]
MKLLTTALILLVLSTTSGRSQSPPQARELKTFHFRWSEHLADELDYKHTITTATELSSQERRDLLTFILDRFKHPVSEKYEFMFEGLTDKELRQIAGDTRIQFLDLNGDGKKEIIAQGNGVGACGATGNCIVLVLQSTPKGWKVLLDSFRLGDSSSGFEKIRVMDTSTSSYRDIVLASHVSASERTLEVFRFSNGRYRRSDCYYYRVNESLKNPEISHGCGE